MSRHPPPIPPSPPQPSSRTRLRPPPATSSPNRHLQRPNRHQPRSPRMPPAAKNPRHPKTRKPRPTTPASNPRTTEALNGCPPRVKTSSNQSAPQSCLSYSTRGFFGGVTGSCTWVICHPGGQMSWERRAALSNSGHGSQQTECSGLSSQILKFQACTIGPHCYRSYHNWALITPNTPSASTLSLGHRHTSRPTANILSSPRNGRTTWTHGMTCLE